MAKDTRRLPQSYARAGIPEFWLADARGEELLFRIHLLAQSAYKASPADAKGFQRFRVLTALFRLDGRRDERGEWAFDVREEET